MEFLESKYNKPRSYLSTCLLLFVLFVLYRLFTNNLMSKVNMKGHGDKIAFTSKPSYNLATGNKIYV